MPPRKLDEEVARLRLDKFGVKLTTPTKEQAEFRAALGQADPA